MNLTLGGKLWQGEPQKPTDWETESDVCLGRISLHLDTGRIGMVWAKTEKRVRLDGAS